MTPELLLNISELLSMTAESMFGQLQVGFILADVWGHLFSPFHHPVLECMAGLQPANHGEKDDWNVATDRPCRSLQFDGVWCIQFVVHSLFLVFCRHFKT